MRQLALLILLLMFSWQIRADAQTNPGVLYGAMIKAEPDDDALAQVADIILFRGGQEIGLTRGTLHFLKPVGGKLFGAIFSGDGYLVFWPPTASEQKEFERQTEEKLVDGKYTLHFHQAVLWFNDSLIRELGAPLPLSHGETTREEKSILEKSIHYAGENGRIDVFHCIITELLETDPRPYLFLHCFLNEKKEFFLNYDERRFEEVQAFIPEYREIEGAVHMLRMVNSFHSLSEYANMSEADLDRESKLRYSIVSNTISLRMEHGGAITATSDIDLHARGTGHSTFLFYLDPSLRLDSISAGPHRGLKFHRRDKTWEGIVRLPEQDSGIFHLRFSYGGDFARPYRGRIFLSQKNLYSSSKVGGSFYELSSATGWYPQQEGMERVKFDVTFSIPDDMLLVSGGKLRSDTVHDGRRMLRFVVDPPSVHTSFGVGYFQAYPFPGSDSTLAVTVYDLKGGDPQRVASDLRNSFKLYTYLFGRPTCDELKVVAGPEHHGQAFPDFIHLPWFEDLVGEKEKTIGIGRAHEVAHTWWGLGVLPRSYHDWWLSEAFANYSALMYSQFALKQDGPFFSKLKEWKDNVLSFRKFALGSGPSLGSIALGYRASTRQTPGDYELATYTKGAWVLHMLRMMLVDYTTFKEDKFKAIMSEFFTAFRDSAATTDDFRLIVEKHVGGDMRWFFNQWVYGTDIPTIKCTKSVEKTTEGKYSVTLWVEQSDVTKPFILVLPLEIDYRDGTKSLARLMIDSMKKEFTYTLDREPTSIKFDAMESLLTPIEQ